MAKIIETQEHHQWAQGKLAKIFAGYGIKQTSGYSPTVSGATEISFPAGCVRFKDADGVITVINRETGEIINVSQMRNLQLTKIREMNRTHSGFSK